MATQSIGKLEVEITGNTHSLEAAERRASKSMKNMESAALTAASVVSRAFVAGAVLAGIVAIGTAVDASAKSMANMAKSASSLGFTVDQFSRISYASQAAGVSAEALDNSVKELTRRLSNVDPMSETTRALQALGLAYEHSTTKGMGVEKTLMSVAERFSTMKDGANKSALAMALFGEQGLKLIPFLNKGKDGIKELMGEADRLGITMGKEGSQAAIEYTENISKVASIAQGMANSFAREILPSVNSTTAAMIDWAKSADIINKTGELTRWTITALSDAWVLLKGAVSGSAAMIVNFFSAIGKASEGEFKAALDMLRESGTVFTTVAESFSSQLSDNQKIISALRGTTDEIKKQGAAQEKVDAPRIKSAHELLLAEQQRKALYASMASDIQADNTATTTDKIARLNEMVRSGQITWRDYVTTVRSLNEAETQQALSSLMSNDQLPMTQKVADLNKMWQDGKLGIHEYANALKQVNDQGTKSMDDLMSMTSTALTSIFKESKTAAIASAIINTYQGISKAIATYPPPVSYAMAGLQAAMGFAQVAAIRNTSKNSSSAGSGSVSASAPAAAAASAPSLPNQDSTLYVKGLDAKGMFTGDVVRDLAKKLVTYQRDGGKVIIA